MPESSDPTVAISNSSPGNIQSGDTHERRLHSRSPFSAAAEVYDLGSQARVAGRCSDISAGGCYLDTLTPLNVGSTVRVRIVRELREFEASAIVAYTHVGMGMGLTFTEIRSENQEILNSWISGASGVHAPERAAHRNEAEPNKSERSGALRMALNELITLLVRKKLVSEEEAAELLRRMYR